MTDPLRELFTTHLPHLTGPSLVDYLKATSLPAEPVWTDDNGREWSLSERIVEFMLTTRPTRALQELFLAQIHQESTWEQDMPMWNRADETDRRARVRLWLALQRVGDDIPRADRIREYFSRRFKTSFAKKPEGWPASGWGMPDDGGWLGYAFQELDAARTRAATPEGADWSATLGKWMDASLLGRVGLDRYHWWSFGSVAKSRKGRFHVGDAGWEAPQSLPNEADWCFHKPTVRPKGMPEHWSRLMTEVTRRMAESMRQSRDFSATDKLYLLEVARQNHLGKWLTPALQEALLDLAKAGLLSPASSSQVVRQYDGRSLAALDVLLLHDPKATWADSSTRRQLAQAVRDHQKALEQSPHPHERAMASMPFAPAASSAFLWASMSPSSSPSRPAFR